ncbi:PHP domain-containing protein [Psychrobacillus lasiicapitis]|uniref:PHP domain-containing protein n=1 Tax=Psychrobacillus lasiicapitis TaxID=1636719 RepID=A0A544T6T4_9BACI|nr:PHP domain-containing protein [Psychrobacillus lasiicapitis]TQR13163.1 PHP domain-containing protein [Psychrobacillus lasiicapitis]GGA33947.1 phosphatase [Psychrobacillus lasiicapitis]
MKADLHVHSSFSDGSEAVETVLKLAKERDVTQISFVDHDTVKGLSKVCMLGEKYQIEVIPGIEISAYDFKRDRKVHILGYNYDPEAVHIRAICDDLLKRRQTHSLWQIKQIQKAGYKLDVEKIIETAKPSETIYKQHIMRHLTEADYTSLSYKQLYKSLFKGVGVASGDIVYIDAVDAVKAIVADGGLAVVAHPGQLDSYDLIPELIPYGLGGIERNHPDHTASDYQKVEALAKRYGLVMTGGTDFHGAYGAPIPLGEITSPSSLLKSYK